MELKKWVSNNDAVTEAILETVKSISNARQVEVEPNTAGPSVHGQHRTITDDYCQVGNNQIMFTNSRIAEEDSVASLFSN